MDEISNELAGASLFFQPTMAPPAPRPQLETLPLSELPPTQPPSIQVQHGESETGSPSPSLTKKPGQISRTHKESGKHDPMSDSMNASMHAFIRDNMKPVNYSNRPNDLIETIRKSVKQVGKEEFFMRLTPAEKSEVNKILFTFNELSAGEGRKISANDIGRIAIHNLLMDYKQNGEKSVLVLVLEALNA